MVSIRDGRTADGGRTVDGGQWTVVTGHWSVVRMTYDMCIESSTDHGVIIMPHAHVRLSFQLSAFWNLVVMYKYQTAWSLLSPTP